jgi:hypothetical protein
VSIDVRIRPPARQDGVRITLSLELLHLRSVCQGDRLVIADDSPVEGQLEQLDLAPYCGEDRLAADPGRLGNRVYGRRSEPSSTKSRAAAETMVRRVSRAWPARS